MTRIDSHDTTSATPRARWTRPALAGLGLAAALTLTACGGSGDSDASGSSSGSAASSASPSASASTGTGSADAIGTATINDPQGKELGTATFTSGDNGTVTVDADVSGMDPGFYGFHVHTTGKCEADSPDPKDSSKKGDFLSAGGHLNPDDSQHPDHAGDLPTLLVTEDGSGTLSFQTDRLNTENLLDDDGSAVMIHSKPDNYANIPERYSTEAPDEETTKAGDAGDRIGCGTLQSSGN